MRSTGKTRELRWLRTDLSVLCVFVLAHNRIPRFRRCRVDDIPLLTFALFHFLRGDGSARDREPEKIGFDCRGTHAFVSVFDPPTVSNGSNLKTSTTEEGNVLVRDVLRRSGLTFFKMGFGSICIEPEPNWLSDRALLARPGGQEAGRQGEIDSSSISVLPVAILNYARGRDIRRTRGNLSSPFCFRINLHRWKTKPDRIRSLVVWPNVSWRVLALLHVGKVVGADMATFFHPCTMHHRLRVESRSRGGGNDRWEGFPKWPSCWCTVAWIYDCQRETGGPHHWGKQILCKQRFASERCFPMVQVACFRRKIVLSYSLVKQRAWLMFWYPAVIWEGRCAFKTHA